MVVLQYDDKSNLIFIEFFKQGVCCCVSGTTFSFLKHSSVKAVPENSFWDIVQLFMVRRNSTNNKHDILTRSKSLCDPSAGLTALRTSVLFNIASFSVWAWNKKHSDIGIRSKFVTMKPRTISSLAPISSQAFVNVPFLKINLTKLQPLTKFCYKRIHLLTLSKYLLVLQA